MNYNFKAISILFPIVAVVIFTFWYQWSARALLPIEVDTYMQIIEAQTKNTSSKHDLPALRKFLNEDDGKPIYTVNMYNFNKIANYPTNSGFDGSGEQAYDRFSQTMVKLMLKRGSHPIFGSDWRDPSSSNWERIVIVRYRSRRDLADLFATPEFADASLHKWASIKDHERMLVKATHVPNAILIVALIAQVFWALILMANHLWFRSKPLA